MRDLFQLGRKWLRKKSLNNSLFQMCSTFASAKVPHFETFWSIASPPPEYQELITCET